MSSTMSDGMSILLVDDEESARLSLAELLRLEGYPVTVAAGGREAIEALGLQPFDMLITDLKMPEVDGLAVMKAALTEQPGLLIVLLTAFGTLETAVQAMRQGGFDYLLKPAEPDEILETVGRARDALRERERRERLLNQIDLTLQELRGSNRAEDRGGEARILAHAGIIMDVDQHVVSAYGNDLELTPTEFGILALLLKQPGRTFSSEEILGRIKGFPPEPGAATAAVRVYISRLRQKIERDPRRPRHLQTVRGVGYRFAP